MYIEIIGNHVYQITLDEFDNASTECIGTAEECVECLGTIDDFLMC